MHKRGQLTIFILLGAVLLIAVALLIQMRTPATEAPGKLSLPTQFRPVEQALQTCINNRLEVLLRFAGVQGGYLEVPSNVDKLRVANVSIPLWYLPDTTNIADREEVERQLSNRLAKEAERCAALVRVPGFTITLDGPATSKVSLTQDGVIAAVELPAVATAGNTKARLDTIDATSDIPFGTSLDQATRITNKLDNDKRSIDLTLLLGMPSLSTIYNHTRLEKVFVMRNAAPRSFTGSFDFVFGVRLADIKENLPPVFEKMPPVIILQGETVSLHIKAHDPEGGSISYDIISKQFTIGSNGLLTVTGEEPGRYDPIVRVVDEEGLAEYMTVEVIVL